MTEEDRATQVAEDLIGSFNSNDRADVAQIKDLSKTLIRLVYELDNNDQRRKAIAYTHIEQAAMMAVKSIFSGVE